jgi:hypothetical protein
VVSEARAVARRHGPVRSKVEPVRSLAEPSYTLALVPWLNYVLVIAAFLYLPLSTQMLVILRWHYAGGGSGIEKIHPATYLLSVILLVTITLNQGFRQAFAHQLKSDGCVLSFIAAIIFTTGYAVLLSGAPVAPFIDTLFAAAITAVVLLTLPNYSIRFCRLLVDLFFIFNIGMIFAETIANRDFLAPYLQTVVRTPEEMVIIGGQMSGGDTTGRYSALMGHALNAALLFGVYAIGNLSRVPMRLSAPAAIRLSLCLISYLAIFPTQSRSSMVASTIILGIYLLYFCGRIWASGRVSAPGLAVALIVLVISACLAMTLWASGYFDKMLLRFQYDYGSALARDYATTILSSVSNSALWFGLSQEELNSLQSSFGLIAIEISWVNFILAAGLITTIPLLITLFLFLFRTLPRFCNVGIYFVSALVFESTFASNSIWSKTTILTSSLVTAIALCRVDDRTGSLVKPNRRPDRYLEPPGRVIRQRIAVAHADGQGRL